MEEGSMIVPRVRLAGNLRPSRRAGYVDAHLARFLHNGRLATIRTAAPVPLEEP